jgi:hypothetical protein
MAKIGLVRGDSSYEAVRDALEHVREDVCVPPDMPVLIKPNLVSSNSELSATPVGAVRATMDFLAGLGVERFIVGEATPGTGGDTQGAFKRYGYLALKDSYDVELRDLNKDNMVTFEILVSCLGNTLTKSSDLFENRISSSRPDKGMRKAVVLGDKLLDLNDKGLNAPERSTANSPLSDNVEPDFHLIEP